MRQALAIERAWSKDQVLEAWLNLTPFRGEIEGHRRRRARDRRQAPAGLDRAESALLAALVRAPNAAPERVAQRACHSAPEDEALVRACPGARRPGPGAPDAACARGRRSRTRRAGCSRGRRAPRELDRRAPAALRARALKRHLRELEGRNVEDGAVVVLDNATGEVLAYVGSSGELSRAGEVDGAAALRQAGSTLKPFLYALAIEERRLTAASILDDSPLAVTTEAGLYVPQNYDRSFRGPVTLRHALAGSIERSRGAHPRRSSAIPPFHARLRALGFDALERDPDHYGFSLALGGARSRCCSSPTPIARSQTAGGSGPRRSPSPPDAATGKAVARTLQPAAMVRGPIARLSSPRAPPSSSPTSSPTPARARSPSAWPTRSPRPTARA
jgi:penicillin-binding protein 1C